MTKKVQNFLKETKEYNLRYALCWFFDLPYRFENSKIKKLKNFSSKCYDYCYDLYMEDACKEYYQEKYEEEYEWDNTPTPCGCTIFNDCTECGSYYMCCNN